MLEEQFSPGKDHRVMANIVFYFFYAPTWDWPPEGPIKLGNVLTSIKKPEQPFYTAPLPSQSEVYSSEKTDVQCSCEKTREGKFSILTKFFSVIGVGVDIGALWKKGCVFAFVSWQRFGTRGLVEVYTRSDEKLRQNSIDEAYTFKRVETKQFVPKDDYVQKCIEAEAVRHYLDQFRYRKPVYLITGVKTVYGAKKKIALVLRTCRLGRGQSRRRRLDPRQRSGQG